MRRRIAQAPDTGRRRERPHFVRPGLRRTARIDGGQDFGRSFSLDKSGHACGDANSFTIESSSNSVMMLMYSRNQRARRALVQAVSRLFVGARQE